MKRILKLMLNDWNTRQNTGMERYLLGKLAPNKKEC